MKKEEIIKVLQQQDSTVLSFPDRGPWGSNKYRGNCSESVARVAVSFLFNSITTSCFFVQLFYSSV